MLPIPDLDNSRFDYARKYIAQGLDNVLFTWSDTEYRDISYIWKGINPENGEPLRVIVGTPEGAPIPDFDDLPEEFAPGISRDDYELIVKRLMSKM
jgi:Mn-containing catalase